MKIRVLLLTVMFLLSGCYFGNGIHLYNGHYLFGSKNAITVQKGDTLYSLSRRYNVEMKDIISANRLKSPYVLRVGQRLNLPKSRYHTVQKGDTLYAISKKYNTDVTTVSRVNHLHSNDLYIGQKILIPSGTKYTAGNASNSQKQIATAKKTKQSQPVATKKQMAAKSSNVKPKVAAQKTTPVSKNRKSKFAWPVRGTIISKFGFVSKGVKNDGINIKAAKGTAVTAADAGTVAYSGSGLKGYGNLILIKHADGWITAYAHNDKLFVKKGQKVRRGEKIATVGNTGGVSQPQLHFETRAGKNAVNPMNYL